MNVHRRSMCEIAKRGRSLPYSVRGSEILNRNTYRIARINWEICNFGPKIRKPLVPRVVFSSKLPTVYAHMLERTCL